VSLLLCAFGLVLLDILPTSYIVARQASCWMLIYERVAVTLTTVLVLVNAAVLVLGMQINVPTLCSVARAMMRRQK
jgi:hypothetical protein